MIVTLMIGIVIMFMMLPIISNVLNQATSSANLTGQDASIANLLLSVVPFVALLPIISSVFDFTRNRW